MRRTVGFVLFCCAMVCIYGCAVSPDKDFVIRKVSYSALPNWKNDNMQEVLPALQKNCEALKTRDEGKTVCNGIERLKSASSKDIRRFIENTMTPYAVYSYGSDEGTFTGYYEASLDGSLIQDEKNMYPIYGLPNDLVSLDTKTICSAGNDTGTVVGRIENGRFLKYYTRKEIAERSLDAPILLWVEDPVDAFILHIQGSGRVQTPDGVFHVGYAGNNGHEFVGIGSIMTKEGVLEQGKSSMPQIRKWLKNHPEQAQNLMKQNPRYIFFKMLEKADGPLGALGVPLTPKRSIAVDTDFIPLGSLVYLDTKTPDGNALQTLAVAQDKGGAIKGAVRADFFWGYGDDAFYNAGRMKSQGRYFILYPKGVRVQTEK